MGDGTRDLPPKQVTFRPLAEAVALAVRRVPDGAKAVRNLQRVVRLSAAPSATSPVTPVSHPQAWPLLLIIVGDDGIVVRRIERGTRDDGV